MLRDSGGKFTKGNPGFWLGKQRQNLSGINNPKWVGGDTWKNCLVCKKKFPTRGKRRLTGKYCSHSCRAKWNFSGSKNVNWKGGIPREERTELLEYENWRKEVYKRDKWLCKICGYKGRQIVAHHIKTFKHFPEERFNIKNGITLCRGCHCKLHTIHKNVTNFEEILNDYTLNTER